MRKAVLSQGLPPKSPLMAGTGLGAIGRRKSLQTLTPVHWSHYFKNCEDISLANGDKFRVYSVGESGPVVLCIHGGGFSALTWALFASRLAEFVECRVFAFDLRGHGDTKCADEENLSIEVLKQDVKDVVEALFGADFPPPISIVGHSMGGALAVHVANEGMLPSLQSLTVIDVAEGTALDALSAMQSVLRGRPKSFPSITHAIAWAVRSSLVRNPESVRVSMPGQIKNARTGAPGTSEVSVDDGEMTELGVSAAAISSPLLETVAMQCPSGDAILEEEEEEDEGSEEGSPRPNGVGRKKTDSTPSASTSTEAATARTNFGRGRMSSQEDISEDYVWRINLAATEPYWAGWFEKISSKFLSCKVPLLLVLAGIDRLDKDLTVGQMQGKFQMCVVDHCGHALHEDSPERTAEVVAGFLVRNKIVSPLTDFPRTLPAC